jgi:hypothetical protein
MKSIINISRHLNTITQENLTVVKRVIDFQRPNNGLWNGSKRYAH